MYEKLKELREKKGYSIDDMAKVIDKSACNYFKKESGKVKFSVNEAIKIASFLKTRVEKIFFTEELSETEQKEEDLLKIEKTTSTNYMNNL